MLLTQSNESINNLHDGVDVASFIGQLLCEAHNKLGMKDMFCISKTAIKVACCWKEIKGT